MGITQLTPRVYSAYSAPVSNVVTKLYLSVRAKTRMKLWRSLWKSSKAVLENNMNFGTPFPCGMGYSFVYLL